MDFIPNDIFTEGTVKVRFEAVGGDLGRLAGRYPVSFMTEMARQLTSAIESATGIEGVAGSSVELIMAFSDVTYMEHISGNVTYRRLLLIDAVSAPRDFWVKWTRLGLCEGEYSADNILFELGEDVDQKIREKEYRYLLQSGGEKYHNSMGRKKVTEWREVIRRAVKRGELTKIESDFELAPETLELEERIADLLGKRIGAKAEPEREEIPYITPADDEFERAMEKARMVVLEAESESDEELTLADVAELIVAEVAAEDASVLTEEEPGELLLEDEPEEDMPEEELIIEDEDDGDLVIDNEEDEEFIIEDEAEDEELIIEEETEENEENEEPESGEEFIFGELELESVAEETVVSDTPAPKEFEFIADPEIKIEILEEEDEDGDVEDPEIEIEIIDEAEEEISETEETEKITEEPIEEPGEIIEPEEIIEEPVVEELPEEPEIEEPEIEELEIEEPEEEPAEEISEAEEPTPVVDTVSIADRVADIRAELEVKIRLEYEIRAREKAEAEMIELRRSLQRAQTESEQTIASLVKENERLRLEYQHLLEQTENERLAREAEEARLRLEEQQLRRQIEGQLRAEAAERERLAEAARMAIEEQHRLEAENARIARQKEQEERIEQEKRRMEEHEKELEALRQAELERIRREDEEARARAKNAMPEMGDGRYSYTSKNVKLIFRKSVDPNITARIQEIIKATVDYYGKDGVYLRIKASVPDTQTVLLEFAEIPIEEMTLLGNIIKILGNSGLGIAKAIIE